MAKKKNYLNFYIYCMQIWTYKELREQTTNGLLELLTDYLELKDNLLKLIKKDNESVVFYNKEHIVNYDINIRKIKNELVVRSKNKYSK